MILYVLLSLLWLACGARAAYIAHTGLKRDTEEQSGVPGPVSLGGVWTVWGPFLGFLVVLGLVSLISVKIIDLAEQRRPVEVDES